jgi:hypothetical protein
MILLEFHVHNVRLAGLGIVAAIPTIFVLSHYTAVC